VPASCVTMSNLDLVSRRETVVNPGMNDKLEKKNTYLNVA
jgi:hypothetical protein